MTEAGSYDVHRHAGVTFWAAALDAKAEPLSEASSKVYRRLRLPDYEVRILLQRTDDPKSHKGACTWT